MLSSLFYTDFITRKNIFEMKCLPDNQFIKVILCCSHDLPKNLFSALSEKIQYQFFYNCQLLPAHCEQKSAIAMQEDVFGKNVALG